MMRTSNVVVVERIRTYLYLVTCLYYFVLRTLRAFVVVFVFAYACRFSPLHY